MKESEDTVMMMLMKMIIQSSRTTALPFLMRNITSLVSWCAFLVLRETYPGSIFVVVVTVAIAIIVLFLMFLLKRIR
jgi:hypothetical protein